MIPTLFGLAWAGVALAAVTSLRPPPTRVRSLAGLTSTESQASAPRRRGPLEVLGSGFLRPARRSNLRPTHDRAVGAAVVGTALALALAPVLVPVPLTAAWALPRVVARREEGRRLRRFEADLPETVDLLAMAVGAGCNVRLAVDAAGRRGTGPLAAELRRVTDEVDRGRRLADALDDLPSRAGGSTRPLTSALAGCERYGAPLVPTLERIADDVRRQRRRRAEEAARKVPVALLFPLVLCILPAFAMLTVAPLVAGALRELRL
ncbi:MAG: type II secretion system F family protein [Actinomycetota bacterium]|nr:type II secretion system F family protein [Actinomycetota bacterium]